MTVDGELFTVDGGNFALVEGDRQTGLSEIAVTGSQNISGSLRVELGEHFSDPTIPYIQSFVDRYGMVYQPQVRKVTLQAQPDNDYSRSILTACYEPTR